MTDVSRAMKQQMEENVDYKKIKHYYNKILNNKCFWAWYQVQAYLVDIFNLTTSSVLVCCVLGILQIFSMCVVDILRTLCVVDIQTIARHFLATPLSFVNWTAKYTKPTQIKMWS